MAECRVRNILDEVVGEKQLTYGCLPCQGGVSQILKKVSRQVENFCVIRNVKTCQICQVSRLTLYIREGAAACVAKLLILAAVTAVGHTAGQAAEYPAAASGG